MDNKKIAQHALAFIGGTPTVFEYQNEDNTVSVDIMTCPDKTASKLSTLSTIGLANADIGKEFDGKPLKVELMMIGRKDKEIFANILAEAAFRIKENQHCEFGLIIENVIEPYIDTAALKHVVLMQPVFWKNYSPCELDGNIIAWLLALPISEKERLYIAQNGIDKFDEMLEKAGVDLADLQRADCT